MEFNLLTLMTVLVVPALLGLLAAAYLRPVLSRLLEDVCGTVVRADFWTRMACLGMVVTPSALALMRSENWRNLFDAVEMTRALLSISLNGVLIVIAGLALAVWKKVPSEGSHAHSGENK